ncbi:MAG: hypothetical protein K0Q60_1471 [Microvirga sp.]|jgi:uncharacterized protein YjbI with pentapeptide repeats|nr:hypothetical protein [Microvirga sp.]MCD6070091.1 hypothetical protein [Microvirga sp.]
MYHGAKGAALIALLTLTGVTAQAAESTNGSNLNGSNLNGSNLNGSNLNGSNLNGTAPGRDFLGSHVSALITPNGIIVTLD